MNITPTLEAERAAPKLLPCPMCGGPASIVAMEGYQMTMCECGVNYEGPGEEDCAEAWNRRTAAPVAEGVALPPRRSIGDDPKFHELMDEYDDAASHSAILNSLNALIAYIDGRTAGPAVPEAKQPAPNTDADPLYDKAVMIVRARNRASHSVLQQTLLIGYNRANRLLEAMEKNGVVAVVDSNGRRKVIAAAPKPQEDAP